MPVALIYFLFLAVPISIISSASVLPLLLSSPAFNTHLQPHNQVKLAHWDEDVRRLAAGAVVRLAPLARNHLVDAFASVVLPNVLSIDLNTCVPCNWRV